MRKFIGTLALLLALILTACGIEPTNTAGGMDTFEYRDGSVLDALLDQTNGTRRPPSYASAMAGVNGCGYSRETLQNRFGDDETVPQLCLQNAYNLAAALYTGDVEAALYACGGRDEPASDFPFLDLDGLVVCDFYFSGGTQDEEPLWLTLSVSEPGSTCLPVGESTWAVDFGGGRLSYPGAVIALIPQEYYLLQEGWQFDTVDRFISWGSRDTFASANELDPFYAILWIEVALQWEADRPYTAEQIQQSSLAVFGGGLALNAEGNITQPPDPAWMTEHLATLYDEKTDTISGWGCDGLDPVYWRMIDCYPTEEGWDVVMGYGKNSLWMGPGRPLVYHLGTPTNPAQKYCTILSVEVAE